MSLPPPLHKVFRIMIRDTCNNLSIRIYYANKYGRYEKSLLRGIYKVE